MLTAPREQLLAPTHIPLVSQAGVSRLQLKLLGVGRLDGIPGHPGRGAFVCHGEVTELQVFLADGEESAGVLLGDTVVGGPGGNGSEGGDAAHAHDGPAHEGDPATHQADTDRNEQEAPQGASVC